MERFSNFISMVIEAILMAIIYLIILPFKVLYIISNRFASR